MFLLQEEIELLLFNFFIRLWLNFSTLTFLMAVLLRLADLLSTQTKQETGFLFKTNLKINLCLFLPRSPHRKTTTFWTTTLNSPPINFSSLNSIRTHSTPPNWTTPIWPPKRYTHSPSISRPPSGQRSTMANTWLRTIRPVTCWITRSSLPIWPHCGPVRNIVQWIAAITLTSSPDRRCSSIRPARTPHSPTTWPPTQLILRPPTDNHSSMSHSTIS